MRMLFVTLRELNGRRYYYLAETILGVSLKNYEQHFITEPK